MGDCCDRSAAVEAGVLKPRAVRLMKKAHLKMDVIHPSPLVINVKKIIIIILLQAVVITLRPITYAIIHLHSL